MSDDIPAGGSSLNPNARAFEAQGSFDAHSQGQGYGGGYDHRPPRGAGPRPPRNYPPQQQGYFGYDNQQQQFQQQQQQQHMHRGMNTNYGGGGQMVGNNYAQQHHRHHHQQQQQQMMAGYNQPHQQHQQPMYSRQSPAPNMVHHQQHQQMHQVPQHPPPMRAFHQGSREPAPNSLHTTPQPAPSYVKEIIVPKVILVTGYRMTGKTTVAKELAKERGYEYVSLKVDADSDDDSQPITERLKPLTRVLERKATLKGIVIDDALVYSKFEPYYVNFLLEKAGLHIDILVIITSELSDLVSRGIEFDYNNMKAHPESFEFGEKLEEANSNAPSTPIAVVMGTEELDTVVQEAIKQVKEVESMGLPPLLLPTIEFTPGSHLITNPDLVDEILEAQLNQLELMTLEYGFPYSEPNFLLDYVQFVKGALLFKEYLIKPWIWGDKISIIAYGGNVYAHLPSYQVVFQITDISAPFKEVVEKLNKEAGEPSTADSKGKCVLCLEAAMLDKKIYISDMMIIGKKKGSKMLLDERVALMSDVFGKLPPSGSIVLLEHFPVSQINACMAKYADVARGVLFVNPDGIQPGSYESRNYLYPSEENKSVKIRIWGGRMEDTTWVFDAYAFNDDDEEVITSSDETPIPVYISDQQVGEFTINDGNIIECVLEQTAAPQPSKGGKKGANKSQSTPFFVFRKRCNWQVSPTTLYYQENFVRQPIWSTESFLEACSTVQYRKPMLPE